MFTFRKKKPIDPWSEFDELIKSSSEILHLNIGEAIKKYGSTFDAKVMLIALREMSNRVSYLEGKIKMFNAFYGLEENNDKDQS
jgi:hypothetical protein